MKKGFKKAKEKVVQLISDSRSGLRSQTPVPPDPDLGQAMEGQLIGASATSYSHASTEVALSPSNVSPGQMQVRRHALGIPRRANWLQVISNKNKNKTYNYRGQVLNYNPVVNNIYLTKKEV